MCGIVGAVAQRDVVPILIEGLKRLEYRGYDSAGLAVLNEHNYLERVRTTGKVRELELAYLRTPLRGTLGIAHTRWATHGRPSMVNAHPHFSHNRIAVVHNGIVENYEELRSRFLRGGYEIASDTDTEIVAHCIYSFLRQGYDLLAAVRAAAGELEGNYAVGVIDANEPGRLIALRRGSPPLAIGLGIGEHYIASDAAALLPLTQRFIYLQEGDIADISVSGIEIYSAAGTKVERPVFTSHVTLDAVERGQYRHYMLKEIYEQPRAVRETFADRISGRHVLDESFGPDARTVFDKVRRVQIVACGTSYHAGQVARYWFESIARVPCQVEVASEFRYRQPVVMPNTLVVFISQSGETADTLAAMHEAKRLGFTHSLAICNVPHSSLVRDSELVLMTHAGPEIGVASTKAFTTQLVALLLLVIALGRRHGLSATQEAELVAQLVGLPTMIEGALALDEPIQALSEQFADKQHALFLGRGAHYPVAMEGALKLKEISYIHAEAYPAGELKHGPLALVDGNMPVVAVAPNNSLLEKLKSNLQEVRARGGRLFVFGDARAALEPAPGVQVLNVAPTEDTISPIVYTIPLQLLAYHVAVLKGTDVDQPRNLAKSVTVE
jgi:glucosamine--fructose-6-phosphate aminotransferase (isomerizing)